MAKFRTIHQNFYTDEKVEAFDITTRYFFIGLFSIAADDWGRFENRPRLLNRLIFPWGAVKDEEIVKILKLLVDKKMIKAYSVQDPDTEEEREYFYLIRWERYQRPTYVARPLYPDPPDYKPQEELFVRAYKNFKVADMGKEGEKIVAERKEKAKETGKTYKEVLTDDIKEKRQTKDTEIQTYINTFFEHFGQKATNWSKCTQAVKILMNAKIKVEDTILVAEHLQKDPFWADKALDLMTVSNRAPSILALPQFRGEPRKERLLSESEGAIPASKIKPQF